MRAFIAFGSNLGDRLGHFREARQLLAGKIGPVAGFSPVFATEPWDCEPGAGEFYNGVVVFQTDLAPDQILDACQEIEARLGRPKSHARHVSRTIDLDVLAVEDLTWDSPELTLPHPRARERMFVLAPLAALDPDFRFPRADATVREWLAELSLSEPVPAIAAHEW